MKLLTRFACALLLPLFSQFLFAADTQVTVCQLGAEGANDMFLMPCEGWTTQQSCPNSGWVHWTISNDTDRIKASNAQAALLAGKNIILRVQGCSAGFDNVYMLRLIK